MANHQSALKRIRQTKSRNMRNRYFLVTARNAMRKLRGMTDKKEAEEYMPKVFSMIDKLAKRNVYHDNKADNLKAKLNKHVSNLS
jgi:small subunit ribosomal protein S20